MHKEFTVGTATRPLYVAIIGSGPSAFYAAGDLLKRKTCHVEVHMFERLPTPYGLVRGGVAPDHQNIKAVTKIYERIANLPHFHFWGNVTFGKDIVRSEILEIFDAVIYAVGAPSDRRLHVAGEELQGSYSATEFVGWYNGHPDFREHEFNLSAKSVAIIGMGNVALDVARILAKTKAELAKTDITDYALEQLSKSAIDQIYLIARRGPVQAAFTPVEAKEFLSLEEANAWIEPQELELEPCSQQELDQAKKHSNQKHNFEILEAMSQPIIQEKPRNIQFLFRRSPQEILGENGKVKQLKLKKNTLMYDEKNERIDAVFTGEEEILDVDLVFRSIGYLGKALPGVAFEKKKGTIPNDFGRVQQQKIGENSDEYVVGWAKRGPTGVIGTNKPDSVQTVETMLSDFSQRELTKKAPLHLGAWLKEKGTPFITFSEWKQLDEFEMEEGKKHGKVREKVTNVSEMLHHCKK